MRARARVCWPARGMLLPPLHSTLIAVYHQREGSSESGSRGVVCLLLDDIKWVLCEGRSQSSPNQSQVVFITILNMEFQPTNKTCFYFLAICHFFSRLQPAIARHTPRFEENTRCDTSNSFLVLVKAASFFPPPQH